MCSAANCQNDIDKIHKRFNPKPKLFQIYLAGRIFTPKLLCYRLCQLVQLLQGSILSKIPGNPDGLPR